MKKEGNIEEKQELTKEQQEQLKQVIIQRLEKEMWNNKDSNKKIMELLGIIREEKNNMWLSRMFQVVNVGLIGATVYRHSSIPFVDFVTALIAGVSISVIATVVYHFSKKNKVKSENEFFSYIKDKARDKNKVNDEYEYLETYNNLIVSDENLNKTSKNVCNDMINNYENLL